MRNQITALAAKKRIPQVRNDTKLIEARVKCRRKSQRRQSYQRQPVAPCAGVIAPARRQCVFHHVLSFLPRPTKQRKSRERCQPCSRRSDPRTRQCQRPCMFRGPHLIASFHRAPVEGPMRAIIHLGVHWVPEVVRLILVPRSVILLAVISGTDRKSTRLNSSHSQISYAVFCLKK